jgi:hypothetical protein
MLINQISRSHLATTYVAKQFPSTFTDVRPISIIASMAKIANAFSGSKPKEATVLTKIKNDAPRIPATPFEVSIKIKHICICCDKVRSTPQACATNTEASDKYKVVPSKLKLYPVGSTNATTFLGIPIFSKFSIAFGSAASELAVEKAIETGSEIA